MSPNGSVRGYWLPCLRTWTLPGSVACGIGTGRGSTKATPVGLAETRAPGAGTAAARLDASSRSTDVPLGPPLGPPAERSSTTMGVSAVEAPDPEAPDAAA